MLSQFRPNHERIVQVPEPGTLCPYNCVELHKYAKPLDIQDPITVYEEELMDAPIVEGAQLSALQGAIRRIPDGTSR